MIQICWFRKWIFQYDKPCCYYWVNRLLYFHQVSCTFGLQSFIKYCFSQSIFSKLNFKRKIRLKFHYQQFKKHFNNIFQSDLQSDVTKSNLKKTWRWNMLRKHMSGIFLWFSVLQRCTNQSMENHYSLLKSWHIGN